jgi:hypothetical protein
VVPPARNITKDFPWWPLSEARLSKLLLQKLDNIKTARVPGSRPFFSCDWRAGGPPFSTSVSSSYLRRWT